MEAPVDESPRDSERSAVGDRRTRTRCGGMGFLGIYNSVAVMFDTYQNNAAYGDPNGNYIAVNTRERTSMSPTISAPT